jgi:pimeloyl-ACP methyl ester carboxylesterase
VRNVIDLDVPGVSTRVFFPDDAAGPEPFHVEFGEGRLACYRETRHPSALTVLYFHGNGETAWDSFRWLGPLFDRLRVNVCFAEYRGYGASDGSPGLVSMLEDTERILDALHLPENRVVVFGRSLGSIYAIDLASRRPDIAGLVIESGIADVAERLIYRLEGRLEGVSNESIAEAAGHWFDHKAKLEVYPGELLILHASHDDLIHRSHAERNFAWSGSSKKELVVFPEGGHNTILVANFDEYEKSLRTFFERIEGRASTERTEPSH